MRSAFLIGLLLLISAASPQAQGQHAESCHVGLFASNRCGLQCIGKSETYSGRAMQSYACGTNAGGSFLN